MEQRPVTLHPPATIVALLEEEDGQDLIEYALIVAVLAFASIALLKGLNTSIATAFTNFGNALTSST